MDACFRLAYFIAYHIARVWWILRRPSVTGSNVAIWRGGRLLLLRSSYRKGWQFPGGFMHATEIPQDAAIREAKEEIGVVLSPAELTGPFVVRSRHEFRQELNYIFEVLKDTDLSISTDNREIVEAAYFSVQEISKMTITPTVRLYLDIKVGRTILQATS